MAGTNLFPKAPEPHNPGTPDKNPYTPIGIKSGPSEVLGYWQDNLFYRDLDAVNQREDYWVINSNNKLEMVKGVGGNRVTNAVSNSMFDFSGSRLNAIGSAIGDIFSGKVPPIAEDSLAGDTSRAVRPDPEVEYVLRRAVSDLFGRNVGADAVDPNNLMQIYIGGSREKALLFEGEKLEDTSWYQNTMEALYGPNTSPDAGKGAPPPVSLKDAVGSVEGGTDSGSGLPVPSGGGSDAGKSGGGSSLGGKVTLPSGPGPGGVQITSDLLRDYVDSDFAIGFNAAINNFKDAGAAAHFINWLQNNFNTFRGEALGEYGNQALAGQVPTGGFTDYLIRKGLLSGEVSNEVAPGFESFVDRKSGSSATPAGDPVDELAGDTPPIAPSAGEGKLAGTDNVDAVLAQARS